MPLREGDKAPPFSAPSTNGRDVRLSEFKRKPVVLYFYPRDGTPGCTREACGFRDHHPALQEAGAAVLAASLDPIDSHRKFAAKFKLPFPLLSDHDKVIARAYGVRGEKTFLGRKSMGMHRITFLIGPDGRIRKIWPKVSPVEHAQEVLEALTS